MRRATVLYDAECGFCRVSLALLLAWDRGGVLRPVALQSPEAERLLEGMTNEERMASWHLVGSEGDVRSAGAAFSPVLRLLPGAGPVARLADRFPAAAEGAYAAVAARRSLFGRLLPAAAKRWADRKIRERT
jgi:predicted DCC family thiol-disulfide oxidoreductase YuxK